MYNKRRRIKAEEKERPVRPSFGQWNNPYFNAGTGSTYVGPNYPQYSARLTESGCLALHQLARVSPYATTSVVTGTALGHEYLRGIKGRKSNMNNVLHTKLGLVNYPYLCMYKDSRSSAFLYRDYYRSTTTHGYALYLAELNSSIAEGHRAGVDKGFSARAFWSMRPKFEGQVSLINSLFELKDFKDILSPGTIVNAFRRVSSSKLFSTYSREFSKLARKEGVLASLEHHTGIKHYADSITPPLLKVLARDLTGAAAASVLTMNLAIKPTIADALGITAQLATTAKEAEQRFAQAGDDGNRSHFSEHIRNNQVTPYTGPYYWVGEGLQSVITRTATMVSYYSYKLRTLTERLVQYWGLAGSVEALWNMLPLSFVVDYVFTIGKSLSFMKRDNNVANLTTEYCESVKITSTDGLHIVQDPLVHALVIDGVYIRRTSKTKPHLVSGTMCTRYERKVMEPYKGPALPRFKLPSTTQAVNMLALIRCFTM